LEGGAALLANAAMAKLAGQGTSAVFAQDSRKRIYIAPDDHTDYMWTADEATYRQAFLEMLDYYLDLADATQSNPPEYQSRWNCDGSFWLWTYEKNRTAAQFQRLMDRIRDGHISAPLNALVVCLGGAPAEAVLRGMYYAGQLERRHNLRFPMAIAMENQVLPYGLGALWAGAGAKYSWKGVCGCASKIPYSTLSDRDHEIYWWVGPDDSRVLMKWNSKSGDMGGYAEARVPGAIVDYVDSDSAFRARYPYDVIGCFGKGWDDLKTLTAEFITTAQAKTNASRQVIVSNEQDFFQDFEANHGASIPSVSASYGNEWDLYCASMAEVSARVKRAVEKLRAAEALATLVSMQDPAFANGRQGARDQAWMGLGLYWEHDWTADGAVSRDARGNWQRRIAGDVEAYVNALLTDGANALGGMIQKSGASLRFFAFNPLSWARTDLADFPFDGASPVHVIDLTTGQEAPSQIVTVDGQRRLRVLAQDVPSVGYKVFEVRSGSGQSFGNAATVNGGVIEDSRYRVTVAARGAITSLVDKTRNNREFVRTIGARAANDLGSAPGALTTENAGPVSVTVLATSSGPLSHTSRITLVRGVDRIDIRNDIDQNFGSVQSWAFGFNLDNPDVWHEEVGAVIRARLLAAGGHYAPRNARYDWLTLNHFADVSGGGVGATLSNADCYFMRLGNSTVDSLDTATPQISPLVGGQVDGPSLGIPNQGGDSRFLQRFALRTHGAFDPATAMRFALEHQNPLVTGVVTGGPAVSGPAYPETSFSLLTISDPNVLLWALKPAEDGPSQGIVVRLWNLSASPITASLRLMAGPITQAWRLTHIETPVGSAAVSDGVLTASLNAHQLKTWAVWAGQPLPSDAFVYVPLVRK
jgi:alpha-mannosidase